MALPTAAFSDLAELHPSAHPSFVRLREALAREGLPLYPYETFRTAQRQAVLKREGKSQLGTSLAAHPRRAAVDWILKAKPAGHGRWFTGIAKSPPIKSGLRTETIDPGVASVWLRFGSLIASDFPELEWGGTWGKKPGELIGWDPYHVELRGWRSLPYLPTLPPDMRPKSGGLGGVLAVAALLFS